MESRRNDALWGLNAGRPVLPETVVLAFVCLLDTVSTVILVNRGLAIEANPMLAWSFASGSLGFVSVKLLTFLPPIAAFEFMRDGYGDIVRRGLRIATICYVGSYVFLTLAMQSRIL